VGKLKRRVSYRKSSSAIRSVPMAPRSDASITWSGPYQALISSDASILKNLDRSRVKDMPIRAESTDALV